MTVDEWHECDEMLRAHQDLAGALARRGITDMSRVLTDMWAYGAALVPERYKNRRIGWSDVWYRGSEQGNPYAHHITGLHPVVDLNTMTLLELEDNYEEGTAADPAVMGEYLPRLIPMPLREVTPLESSQPEGVGFTLEGHLLSWQNWELRIGFNHREGLVLHQVGFRDGERLRPVAHRLSFAEMVVPYRDASPDHYRRTAFDIGEWGLGFMTPSLALGCDCLGDITYLDAVGHDSRGEPRTIPNAICVHEEDSGVGWKPVDQRRGRRGRRRGVGKAGGGGGGGGKRGRGGGGGGGGRGGNESGPRGGGPRGGKRGGPAGASPPLPAPASPARQRAEVIGHTLWVTPYRDDERWPCGDFPVHSDHDSGLAVWTQADRPIENTDVVLGYLFGTHHVTRP